MLVNNSIRFSSVDGPGNRFVIFVQGCNFDCIACHNPYTISDCDSCEQCVDPCPEGALSVSTEGLVVVDRLTCTDCDVCIDVCPVDSTPLAREQSTKELINDLAKVVPFVSGITVSGGEATMQAEAVHDLFRSIKDAPELSHLTTFVDSNGWTASKTWDQLAPVTDGVMLDLKALDPATHREMTGQDNAPVLDSIRYLDQIGLLYEVRLLIIPGVNDSDEAVRTTARWLHEVNPDMRIKLIGFRRHGVRPQHAHLSEAEPARLADLAGLVRTVGLPNPVVV